MCISPRRDSCDIVTHTISLSVPFTYSHPPSFGLLQYTESPNHDNPQALVCYVTHPNLGRPCSKFYESLITLIHGFRNPKVTSLCLLTFDHLLMYVLSLSRDLIHWYTWISSSTASAVSPFPITRTGCYMRSRSSTRSKPLHYVFGIRTYYSNTL